MERAHPKAQKPSPPRQFDARFFIIPCTCVFGEWGQTIMDVKVNMFRSNFGVLVCLSNWRKMKFTFSAF